MSLPPSVQNFVVVVVVGAAAVPVAALASYTRSFLDVIDLITLLISAGTRFQ